MVEEWQDGKETEWVEQEVKCDKRVEATRKVDERLFHASINGTLQVVADGRSRVPVTISLDAADKEFSSPHGSQRFTLTREQHRANAVKKLADSITAELAAIKVATGNAEASRARSLANSVARDAEELSLSALLRGCTEGSATDWLTNSYELNRAELSAAFYGGLRLHK